MVANRFSFAAVQAVSVSVATFAMLGVLAGGTAGCSSKKAATPQVTLIAMLGPGDTAMNGGTQCQFGATQTWLQIGNPSPDAGVGASDPLDNFSAVPNGGSQSGDGVTVTCDVHPLGSNTYSVNANAQLAGQGSLTISAKMIGSDPTMVQMPVSMTLERGSIAPTGTFSDGDCTFDFGQEPAMTPPDLGQPPDPHQGIAGGRLWGNLICQNATFPSQNRTCQVVAEMKFENCGE